MAGRLEGKVAIVTGAASGIGRACAIRFAQEGADVVVADLAEDNGRETIRQLTALGRRAVFIRTDVSDEPSTEEMAERTMRELGRLDVLVAAAGIPHAGYVSGETDGLDREDIAAGSLIEKSLCDWDRMIRVNLTGTLLVDRAAARRMITGGRGGSIVNITSLAALTPTAGIGDYCVSKAGAWMITRVLALELGPKQVRVNAIAPGMTETPMTKIILENTEVREQLLSTIALGRFGRPEDVANMALFLASDESSYITGKTIPVDGDRYPG